MKKVIIKKPGKIMNIMGVFTCTRWFSYMKRINRIYRDINIDRYAKL